MSSSPVDPSLARQEASAADLARRKMDMDALRKRLGDTTTKQEKLRESCEGFEAIFLQKMWEQMRKTVPKEGFLHSKDEETYQSLFDVELCKKMAGAGGIGLADMLYIQLSQQLEHTGRTTTPGRFRNPLNVPPAENLSPRHAASAAPAAASDPAGKAISPADLYSPLPEQNAESDGAASKEEAPVISAVDDALSALKTELGLPKEDKKGVAVAEWATTRAAMTGTELAPAPEEMPGTAGQHPNSPVAPAVGQHSGSPALSPANREARPGAVPAAGTPGEHAARAEGPHEATAPGIEHVAAGQPQTGAEHQPVGQAGPERFGEDVAAQTQSPPKKVNPALLSWQGNGPVSIKGKPTSSFGRNKSQSKSNNAEKTAAAPARGMAPDESVWPMEGMVTNRFGWEDDAATGKRRWNSGITIAAPADSPVRAVLAGRVVYAGQREGYGNTVVLEHKDGYRSYYGNLQGTGLKVGDKIKHGANFAKIATQPSSSPDGENSAFLHFELKKGEMALNPESAIRRMATASR